VSVWWKVAGVVLRFIVGLLLGYVAIAVLVAALEQPQVQNGLIGLGILFAVLWWIWAKLPDWLRKFIHRSIKGNERSHGR